MRFYSIRFGVLKFCWILSEQGRRQAEPAFSTFSNVVLFKECFKYLHFSHQLRGFDKKDLDGFSVLYFLREQVWESRGRQLSHWKLFMLQQGSVSKCKHRSWSPVFKLIISFQVDHLFWIWSSVFKLIICFQMQTLELIILHLIWRLWRTSVSSVTFKYISIC